MPGAFPFSLCPGQVKQTALKFMGRVRAVLPSAPAMERESPAWHRLSPTPSSPLGSGWLQATEGIAHPP